VAKVDDNLRLQAVETWFDPLEMFRQIAPNGSVNKVLNNPVPGEDLASQLFPEEEVLHKLDHSNASTTEGACPFVGNQ
jgi:hypothetical protein